MKFETSESLANHVKKVAHKWNVSFASIVSMGPSRNWMISMPSLHEIRCKN